MTENISCVRPQCHHQFEELNPGQLVCKECGEEREAPERPYDWQVDGL